MRSWARSFPPRVVKAHEIEGFTIIELMIVVVILAILATIAGPSLYEASLSGKIAGYASDLIGSAQLARSEAIKRNSPVTMCVSANGSSCGSGNWNQGWILLASGQVLKVQAALESGIQVNSTSISINFDPSGLVSSAATLTVCRKLPTVGSSERVVAISATGKSTLSKTSAGVCP
jgi:type IV fimbrial biogenesis protein FimT